MLMEASGATAAAVEKPRKPDPLSAFEERERREQRAFQKRVRQERARAIEAGMDDFYDGEDYASLAKSRDHCDRAIGPGREIVVLGVGVPEGIDDIHWLQWHQIVTPTGGVHRVVKQAHGLTEQFAARFAESGPLGKSDSTEADAGELLDDNARKVIAEWENSLLSRVLGGRAVIHVAISIPDEDNELADRELVKFAVLAGDSGAIHAAVKGAAALALSLDPQARDSDDKNMARD